MKNLEGFSGSKCTFLQLRNQAMSLEHGGQVDSDFCVLQGAPEECFRDSMHRERRSHPQKSCERRGFPLCSEWSRVVRFFVCTDCSESVLSWLQQFGMCCTSNTFYLIIFSLLLNPLSKGSTKWYVFHQLGTCAVIFDGSAESPSESELCFV